MKLEFILKFLDFVIQIVFEACKPLLRVTLRFRNQSGKRKNAALPISWGSQTEKKGYFHAVPKNAALLVMLLQLATFWSNPLSLVRNQKGIWSDLFNKQKHFAFVNSRTAVRLFSTLQNFNGASGTRFYRDHVNVYVYVTWPFFSLVFVNKSNAVRSEWARFWQKFGLAKLCSASLSSFRLFCFNLQRLSSQHCTAALGKHRR